MSLDSLKLGRKRPVVAPTSTVCGELIAKAFADVQSGILTSIPRRLPAGKIRAIITQAVKIHEVFSQFKPVVVCAKNEPELRILVHA